VPKYRCRASAHLSIDAEPVDAYVRAAVCDELRTLGASLLAEDRAEEAAALEVEALTLRARLDELGAEYGNGEMSARAYGTATAAVERKLATVENERAALDVSGSALRGVADADDPASAFLALDVERQQAVIRALFVVTIVPGLRGGPKGTTDRLGAILARVRIERR
jgi:site-specific DNA recombinase